MGFCLNSRQDVEHMIDICKDIKQLKAIMKNAKGQLLREFAASKMINAQTSHYKGAGAKQNSLKKTSIYKFRVLEETRLNNLSKNQENRPKKILSFTDGALHSSHIAI